MSERKQREAASSGRSRDRREELRESPTMAHLLEALEQGTDIGHYGRLVFAMTARYFIEDEDLIALLAGQPEVSEEEARAMVMQVSERGYNPPKRERILEWQAEQSFPICPNPEDPSACNLYRELRFPDDVYNHIEEFWQQKQENEG